MHWLREFLRGFAAEGKTVLVSSHVLAEVAQTVDDVLIVNRGKLVLASDLHELIARAGGGVGVVAPEAARLHELLLEQGYDTRIVDTYELLVRGVTTAESASLRAAPPSIPRAVHVHLEPRGGLPRADCEGGMTMIAQLRSEFVKLRSTRTNLGLLAGMIGLVLFIVLVMGFAVDETELATREHQTAMFSLGLAGGFIAALIGVMVICSEFRHGTIPPTFVFTPKRGRVLTAKVVTSLALGTFFGLITEALAFGTGAAVLAIRGAELGLSTEKVLLTVLGSTAVAALMAALGVGFGALVRNQVLAVIGLIVWLMVVENTIMSLSPDIGRFFPLAAGDAMTGIEAEELLSATAGALVLVGYVAAFFAAGTLMTLRKDVR